VWPDKDESFDPRGLRKAVSDAGFSAPEVTLTASGVLATEDGELVLKTAGPVSTFLLSGGETVSQMQGRDDLRGQRIRLSGKLHASHPDQPPGLDVERWEVVPEPEPGADQ
jgi:hypothetical protein